MLIALVGLLNTNAITLFLSRLLKWPNFEQIRRLSIFLLELFSVFFLIWVKLWSKFEVILRSYQTFYVLGQFGVFTNRLKIYSLSLNQSTIGCVELLSFEYSNNFKSDFIYANAPKNAFNYACD